MEIKFSLSALDVARFSLYRFPRSRAGVIMLGIALVAVSYGVLTAVRMTPDGGVVQYIAASIVILTIVLGIYLFVGLGMLVSTLAGANRAMRAERALSLSDDGVLETSPFETRTTRWPGITSVKQNRRFIMLFVTDCAAHVVPKRFFRSRDEASAFYAYAATHAGSGS
jgi:YcxB-like protein